LFGAINSEPKLGPTKPTNGSIVRTMIFIKRCVISHHRNLTKKEIEKWLDRKIHEFTVQENKNPRLKKEQWLNRYLYIKIHEILFCTFLIELYEWIAKLVDGQGRWRLDGLIVWTQKLVGRLEASEDKIMRAVDHWLD